MPPTNLFPTTVEIKRILAAVQRSGLIIGKVEIEPARIRVFSAMDPNEKPIKESIYESSILQQRLKPPTLKRR
jgi:hypothetical protein